VYLSLLALLYSGLVQALIAPPLNLAALHVFSWVPAFWVFSQLTGWRAFLAGWLVGISANLAIFYWLALTLHDFLGIPALLAPVALLLFAAIAGLYVAVFAWGFHRIRRFAGGAWPLAVATWFCALEFVSPQLFTYYQGVAWYQLPQVFLVSSLTGVPGMSFLVMLCNGIVWQGVEAHSAETPDRRAFFLNAVVLLVLVLSAVGYSMQRLAQIERAETVTKDLRIALVQSNHTRERKRELQRMPQQSVAEDLVAQSRRVADATRSKIDVFVWPEGALTRSPAAERNVAVLDYARESGAEIWTGAYLQERNPNGLAARFNSAFRIETSGAIDQRYDKTLLIPFTEYVPFKEVFPGLDWIRPPGDFKAGDGPKVYSSDAADFVFLVCYEAIKSPYVRLGVQRGANLLVIVSGDARSGDQSEQSQHLMLAAIQSALFGVPLVRATTTGISAFVDARGRIIAQTDVFERTGLVGRLRPMQIPSVYSKHGDWFAWSCVAISALMLAMSGWPDGTRGGTGRR